MVTVIANQEELSTPVHNGVTAGSHDHERTFQYIRDYVEVDFHRSPSCKPLPEDLVNLDHDHTSKSSIKGTFFVQIDSIELVASLNNNPNPNQSSELKNHMDSFLLTLTDGITTVKGVTNDAIPNLSCNIRPGSKLLLNGMIHIKDGSLQLTHDNTRFQYGSNTYPRPKPGYRGRGGGSYRPSYEGRRGGTGNSNSRYDNDDSTSITFKGAPRKQTLMDFMTSLNISNDVKSTVHNDNQKSKDRHENKRRNTEQYYQTNKATNMINPTSDSIHHYQSDNDNTMNNEQLTVQQDGNLEHLDPEDDSLHPNFRERRNPLPPRLQRAQEERTRRNTPRYYEDQILTDSNMNGTYRNGAPNHNSMSSASTYSRRGDNTFSMGMNNPPHGTAINTYGPHGNMLGPALGPTAPHLAYFSTNTGHLSYAIGSIPSSPFHTQPPPMNPGYINENLGFCYRPPFVNPTYPSSTVSNGMSDDPKNDNASSDSQTNSAIDGNEIKPCNESQTDDNDKNANNDETKSHSLPVEHKEIPSPTSSSNDAPSNSQQVNVEQHEDKRRDSNSNPRIRWKIDDICLARWSEDQEFYPATIVHIQAPYCTVVFHDYNNYDKVHFSDLKMLPRDQQYYPYSPPIVGPTSDTNFLASNVYYPSRTNYYPPTVDGCIIMPEPPPFPFNSAGTLYMCPPTMTSVSRSNRYQTNGLVSFQPPNRRIENGFMNNNRYNVDTTVDSLSTQSKESNDTSMIDSTSMSIDDNQRLQKQDTSLTTKGRRSCSIADAPISLTTPDDERARSTSTESLTSSKFDEQQVISEEKQANDSSMVDAN